MGSASERRRLTFGGLVVAELPHELCDVENCVRGRIDAVAGPVAAAAKQKMSKMRREGDSGSRIKCFLRQTHGAVHVGKVVPALRILWLQADRKLQQRCGGVAVPLDGSACAAFRIRGSVHAKDVTKIQWGKCGGVLAVRINRRLVIRKSVKECGKHVPAGGAVAEGVKSSARAEQKAAFEGRGAQPAEEVRNGMLRTSHIVSLKR